MKIKDALGYIVGTSSRLMRNKLDSCLMKYDLTTAQWAVIKLLQERGELTQKQISDELLGDKATIGEIINKLEKKGYIIKSKSPTDKRAFNVHLTEKAFNILPDIEIIATMVNEVALKGLQENEIYILYRTLNNIITNLKGEL